MTPLRLGHRIIASAAWLLATAAAPAGAAEIWFGLPPPRPDVAARLRQNPGKDAVFLGMLDRAQIDWDRLFTPGTLDRLAPPMQVAQIGTGFLNSMAEDELADKLGRLVARHIAIDFVAQPVVSDDPNCGHEEGYEDPRGLAATIERLRRLKLPIRTLSMDGGLFAGHYATDSQACRLSLEQTVRQVAVTINAFVKVYPDIEVGEIIPTVPLTREPDWQTALRAYRDGLAAATGKQLAFFELDIAWENPSWKQAVVAETILAHRLGAQIGYIYNGDGNDTTDAAWIAHAERNIAEIEGGLGLAPDHVAFDSWNPNPTHMLGQPGDPTLAALMLDYARPGTRLALAPTATVLAGRLTDLAGQPLAGYRVDLAAVTSQTAGTTALPEQQLSGTVPAGARIGLLALRINCECLCAGPNRIALGDLTYEETSDGARRHVGSFLPDLRHFAEVGGPGIPAIRIVPAQGRDVAEIDAAPDQSLLLNSRSFVATPGARYTLTASVYDRLGTDMYGAIAIIWEDADGHGLQRDNLTVRAGYRSMGRVVTDPEGQFRFPRPLAPDHRPAPLRVTVPDQQGHRGAISELAQ
jgi:hypothetical protein